MKLPWWGYIIYGAGIVLAARLLAYWMSLGK